MKTLIVYYSGTGSNKALAENLAKRMSADIEGIKGGPGSSVIGLMTGAFKSVLGLDARIDPPKYDPGSYDLLVLASPVYANGISLQMKSFLGLVREKIRNVAVASVSGSGNNPKAIAKLEDLAGKKAVAVLELKALEDKTKKGIPQPKLSPQDLEKPEYSEKIDAFVQAIQKGF